MSLNHLPVIKAAAPDLVLKPGTVIDAEVIKLLSDDLVRIAISGLSIEVYRRSLCRAALRCIADSGWYQARGVGRSPGLRPSRPPMP